MDFEYSDEQRLLSESVARFVADRYDFEARLKAMREPDGWSREAWREMAELGLLAMPFAEEDGGYGGGGVETMIVMEALGRGLRPPAGLLAGAMRLIDGATGDPRTRQRPSPRASRRFSRSSKLALTSRTR